MIGWCLKPSWLWLFLLRFHFCNPQAFTGFDLGLLSFDTKALGHLKLMASCLINLTAVSCFLKCKRIKVAAVVLHDHPCFSQVQEGFLSSSIFSAANAVHLHSALDFSSNAVLYLRKCIRYVYIFMFINIYKYKYINMDITFLFYEMALWVGVKILHGTELVNTIAVTKNLCCPSTQSPWRFLQDVRSHQDVFVIGNGWNLDFALTSRCSEIWVSFLLKSA